MPAGQLQTMVLEISEQMARGWQTELRCAQLVRPTAFGWLPGASGLRSQVRPSPNQPIGQGPQ